MSGAQRGILLRPFDPDRDVPDVVALVNEAARAQGGPVTDEAEQRHILELPDHEPRRDRWMAVDARGRPVGFAGVWKAGATPYGELFWAVRPDEVGRRAQGPLLRQALRRTRELGAEALLTYLPPSDHASIDFFVDSGFEAVDGYRRLTLGLETLPSPPVWPDGFRLRLYAEVDRLDVLTQAMNDCFAGLWGHKVVTAETARTVLEASPPDGILLLFDGRAEVAGCVVASELTAPTGAGDDPSGYLDGPGVVVEHREGSLRPDLARAGLRWLAERGHRRVVMETWGEPEATIASYEALGFQRSQELRGFVRRLPGPS